MVDSTPPVDPLEAVSGALIPAPLPAAGLPPEAVLSLRRAFAREVRIRLPRLLAAYGSDPVGRGDVSDASLRADVVMLAEGTRLLGDVASVRALNRLLHLIDEPSAGSYAAAELTEAVGTVALLLGRWLGATPQPPNARA
jgi:hypothetical protein